MGCPNPETLRPFLGRTQGDRMEVLDSSRSLPRTLIRGWNDSCRKAGMTIVGRRE
jgi:hypothetical protein